MSRSEAIRLLAQRALRGYEDLSPAERCRVLEALSKILPRKEAEAARSTAWTIKAAEAQQLKFAALLNGAPRPKG